MFRNNILWNTLYTFSKTNIKIMKSFWVGTDGPLLNVRAQGVRSPSQPSYRPYLYSSKSGFAAVGSWFFIVFFFLFPLSKITIEKKIAVLCTCRGVKCAGLLWCVCVHRKIYGFIIEMCLTWNGHLYSKKALF